MNNYSKGNSAEHAILDLYKNLVEAIDKKKEKKTCYFPRFWKEI